MNLYVILGFSKFGLSYSCSSFVHFFLVGAFEIVVHLIYFFIFFRLHCQQNNDVILFYPILSFWVWEGTSPTI